MVNTCAVPGCSSRSDRETHLSFHALPLTNKSLLKRWIHQIGRTNLPINSSTRVCSRHFRNSRGRKLRRDEYPTENLPQLATRVSTPTPRRPLIRRQTLRTAADDKHENVEEQQECLETRDAGVNTDANDEEMSKLTARVAELEKEVSILRRDSDLNHNCKQLLTMMVK